MNMLSTWIWLISGAVILGSGIGCSGHRARPAPAGLKPCPDSPNCVSSLSSDPRHAIAPIAFTGSAAEIRMKLLDVIRSRPRTRILTDEGGYLHVEFISAVFRFVDDVEFLIDEAHQLIHVRSSSRVGYWDLGANRRRVEDVRRMMAKDAR